MLFLEALGKRWETLKSDVEIADVGFLFLRVAAPAGNYAWLLLSGIPEGEARIFHWIIRYFIVYTLLLYLLLFLLPERKKTIYGISLGFDLSYVSLLVAHSGGYDSSFFIGFYLLTALHSFYYGPRRGLLVAGASAIVYLFSGYSVSALDRIDFFLRASFLFLIALPLGILSAKLRVDKTQIESLNAELLRSIEELKQLQDKLIRAEKLDRGLRQAPGETSPGEREGKGVRRDHRFRGRPAGADPEGHPRLLERGEVSPEPHEPQRHPFRDRRSHR
jgi:hypothetical protein